MDQAPLADHPLAWTGSHPGGPPPSRAPAEGDFAAAVTMSSASLVFSLPAAPPSCSPSLPPAVLTPHSCSTHHTLLQYSPPQTCSPSLSPAALPSLLQFLPPQTYSRSLSPAVLTSTDLQLLPDLLAQLLRRQIFLPVRRVDDVDELRLRQTLHDLNAVPLRQPGGRHTHTQRDDSSEKLGTRS